MKKCIHAGCYNPQTIRKATTTGYTQNIGYTHVKHKDDNIDVDLVHSNSLLSGN